jgi:hypothetical protein
MPKADNLNVIFIQSPSAPIRDAVQDLVKQNTDVWWHQMPDLWIVEGDSPKVWRDRIRSLLIAGGGGVDVLVLPLPPEGRSYAAYGPSPKSGFDWLREYYTGTKE